MLNHWFSLVLTQVSEPHQRVLVEMSRRLGDPILFAKTPNEGFAAGDLPTVFDYGAFADTLDHQKRLDSHHLTLGDVGPTLVHIGVFNDRENVAETAQYTVSARSAPGQRRKTLGGDKSIGLFLFEVLHKGIYICTHTYT